MLKHEIQQSHINKYQQLTTIPVNHLKINKKKLYHLSTVYIFLVANLINLITINGSRTSSPQPICTGPKAQDATGDDRNTSAEGFRSYTQTTLGGGFSLNRQTVGFLNCQTLPNPLGCMGTKENCIYSWLVGCFCHQLYL